MCPTTRCPGVRSGKTTDPAAITPDFAASGHAASFSDGNHVVQDTVHLDVQPSGKAYAALEPEEFSGLSPSPGLRGRRRSSSVLVSLGSRYHDLEEGDGMSPLGSTFWRENRPAVLVALSQLFGALMNLSARLLQLEGDGMHPLQMLLLRQGVTSLCCASYMWWVKIPDFPLGRREIRWLLLMRGSAGFFGIFGMWWSMMYLPLADATVITFLAPGVAGFLCYFLLKEPFTRAEQLATLVALLGVVLIAQPTAFFAGVPLEDADQPRRPLLQQQSQREGRHYEASTDAERTHGFFPGADHQTTPQERILAVGVGLLGVLGAAGAFATLRSIGKRAHPLISVNAFAVICTIICATGLILGPVLDIGQPSMRWVAPESTKQWFLLLSLGVLGFVMQYFLTAGLGADKSNRANAMVYTHMLFAVGFDRWIFDHQMGLTSIAGCSLIMGSAVGVMLLKEKKETPPSAGSVDLERQGNLSGEGEDSPMLTDEAEGVQPG